MRFVVAVFVRPVLAAGGAASGQLLVLVGPFFFGAACNSFGLFYRRLEVGLDGSGPGIFQDAELFVFPLGFGQSVVVGYLAGVGEDVAFAEAEESV